MKIDTTQIKRTSIMLSSRPFWMGRKAFIEANVSLANLRIKLVQALKDGIEEVEATKDETYALALHGITYAKKGTLLAKVRQKLVEITRENGAPAVESLISVVKLLSDKYKDAYKELSLDFAKEDTVLHDEILATEAFYTFNEELTVSVPESNEVDVAVDKLKEMFSYAASVRNSPYNKFLVEFYEKSIKNYIKSKNVKSLPADQQREIYEEIYKSIAYNIHETAYVFEQLSVKGKTLSSMIIPQELENDDEKRRAKNVLIGILREVKSKIDPDFKFSKFKEEVVDKSIEAVDGGLSHIVKLCQRVVSELAEPYEALTLYREKTGKTIDIHRLKKLLEKANTPDVNILEATRIYIEQMEDKDKNKDKENNMPSLSNDNGIDFNNISFS